MLTVGGLFSGIGGWELGLERAGMRVLWHCEADEYCRRVLERHWPGVPCYPDVRQIHYAEDGGYEPEPVDVLCGGFPCQDISSAGAKAGIGGARSGLWSEYARLIGQLRPRYVLVENVAALLARGLDVVLGDLAALGYDAEWDCLPASAFGAPHRRDRVWVVAYPHQSGESHGPVDAQAPGDATPSGRQDMADTAGDRRGPRGAGRPVATGAREPQPERPFQVARAEGEPGEPIWWSAEPDVGRVAHGVPARVDRLRALGNALVPQIAEWIGRRIIDYEEGRLADAA